MKQMTEEHFASHWLTIQPSLFDFLEDEVGELDENLRLFVRIAESVELGRIAPSDFKSPRRTAGGRYAWRWTACR